jgi:integrase
MKLTKKAVEALMLPEGKDDYIVFDQDMPGFGYRLRKSGDKVSRSWVAQYRHAGQTRRMTLNSILSAEQARDEAKKILAKAALGQDPATEKKRRASADRFTFTALAEQYLAAKQPVVRRRTFSEMQRYLRSSSYFGPIFNVPVDSVTRRDVSARVLVIGRESGQVAAARARSVLSGMYAWAMESGLTEVNPTIGTPKPKAPPPRERTLSDPELLAIWQATEDKTPFNSIVRLLITTGQRRSEVGGCCFSELNTERTTWTIPAKRAKNGREHSLPLGSLSREIIASVPEIVGRDLLFGSRTDRGFTSWAEHKRALDARLGDQFKPWTLHDLRRTWATRMCDIGIEPHVVEQILNHQSGHKRGVVGIYNKSKYTRAVENAVAAWDRHLRALIAGGDEKQGKVIAYPGTVVVNNL